MSCARKRRIVELSNLQRQILHATPDLGVTKVENGGAYVSIENHYGFVPKSQIAHEWVDDAKAFLEKGQGVRVKVIKIDRDRDRLVLSIKQCAS